MPFNRLFAFLGILLSPILLFSCSNEKVEVKPETNIEFLDTVSEAYIMNYIDGLDWESEKIIVDIRSVNQDSDSTKCYSCITEDIRGGAEGCRLATWVGGGPIGCAVGGAIVAAYRSVREKDSQNIPRNVVPRQKREKTILPPENNDGVTAEYAHIGEAHNLILAKTIDSNIDIDDIESFYDIAVEVMENMDEFEKRILHHPKVKFGMLYSLKKLNQNLGIVQNASTTNFINEVGLLSNYGHSQALYDAIEKIGEKNFNSTSQSIESQNIEQMKSIAFYTHHYWNN